MIYSPTAYTKKPQRDVAWYDANKPQHFSYSLNDPNLQAKLSQRKQTLRTYRTGRRAARQYYSPQGEMIRQQQIAHSQARAANEQRYADILSRVDRMSDQRVSDIRGGAMDEIAMSQQRAGRLGLGNLSASETMRMGHMSRMEGDINRARDLATERRVGIMERRTDDYPDPGMFAQMLSQFGQYGGGQGSSGGRPRMPSSRSRGSSSAPRRSNARGQSSNRIGYSGRYVSSAEKSRIRRAQQIENRKRDDAERLRRMQASGTRDRVRSRLARERVAATKRRRFVQKKSYADMRNYAKNYGKYGPDITDPY